MIFVSRYISVTEHRNSPAKKKTDREFLFWIRDRLRKPLLRSADYFTCPQQVLSRSRRQYQTQQAQEQQ